MASLAVPLVGSLVSGLAGLFGGKSQQVKTSQDTTQNYNNSASSNPNFSPLQQQLMQLFTGGAQDLYNQSTNLHPYTAQGLEQIGAQGNANRQAIANTLAQRGLSYSPVAGNALTQNILNTGNQQSQFLSQIPLLARQMQQQSLQQLMSAFGVIPTGQTQTGSGTSTGHMEGVNTQSGNPLAGFFGGLGAGLLAPSSGSASNLGSIINGFGGGGKTQTGYFDGAGKWINS